MPLHGSVVIAKYMLKNHIINPLLKSFKTAVAAAIIVIVAIGCVAGLLAILTGEPGEAGESEEASLADAIRGGLHMLGINKYTATDLLSIMLFSAVLLSVVRGRNVLVALDEAEYELLLSQPVDMGTYVLGKVIFQVMQSLLFGIIYMFYAVIAYDMSGGNLAKAAMLPIAIVVLLAFIAIATDLIPVVKVVLGPRARYLELAAYAYTASGVIHSMLTLKLSPILTAPFRVMAESIVMCATLTETWDYVALRLGASTAVTLCSAAVLIRVSRRLHPEFVKPLPEILKESKARRRESVPVYSPKPEVAVTRVVFLRKVVSLHHARIVTIYLGMAVAAGLAFSGYVMPRLGLDEQFISTALFFAIPMLSAEAVTFWAAMTLSDDLLPLWVYRVYSSDLSPLALSLVAKYTVYLTEILMVVAVFKCVLAGDYVALALPVLALPLNVVVSFAVLASLSYLASKRRVVRLAPSGMYVLESMAVAVVFVVVFVPVATIQVLFDALAKEATLWSVATPCLAAVALSPVLAWVLSKVLASIMESLELRT